MWGSMDSAAVGGANPPLLVSDGAFQLFSQLWSATERKSTCAIFFPFLLLAHQKPWYVCLADAKQHTRTTAFVQAKQRKGWGRRWRDIRPSMHMMHRKGKRRRRIPVLKKATRYFVGKTIRFACRPCRYGFLTHSLFSSQPKRQPRLPLIVLEKKREGKK